MSTSLMATAPALGVQFPAMSASNADFPLPLSPVMPMISPVFTCSDKPEKTGANCAGPKSTVSRSIFPPAFPSCGGTGGNTSMLSTSSALCWVKLAFCNCVQVLMMRSTGWVALVASRLQQARLPRLISPVFTR
jgi:hypothetical protein